MSPITFPGPNDGAVPVDPLSAVGQFRVSVGDVTADPYIPPVPGKGNYSVFSDLEIESFLARSGSNVSRAIGFSYLSLAGLAALESKDIADFDLKVNTTKRAADLRLIAAEWFLRADGEEAYLEDAFFVAPGQTCDPVPEGMMPVWGRYAVGKWSC